MSTPTPARTSTTAGVPRPRSPVEPPAAPARRPRPDQPRPGKFERYAWLVPACAIAAVVAAFAAMILLTWAAGGSTPFDR